MFEMNKITKSVIISNYITFALIFHKLFEVQFFNPKSN